MAQQLAQAPFGVVVAGPAVAVPGKDLAGTRWRLPADGAGPAECSLVIENLQRAGVKLRIDGEDRQSRTVSQRGGGLEVVLLRGAAGVTGRLLLWPRPDGKAPKTLTMVLVEDRLRAASVPRVLQLVRDDVK